MTIVPCIIHSRTLLFIQTMYNSLSLLTPNFQFSLPYLPSWQALKLTILKWTIQCIFCAFTMLYNHHFCLVPKHFISKGNSMLIKQLLPIFCSLYPLQPSIWFRFQWIYQFWYFIEMQSCNIWPFVSGFFHLIFLSFIQYYHVQALLFLYMAE